MSLISPNNKWLRRGLQISKSAVFQAFLNRAGGALARPAKLVGLLAKAGKKTQKFNTFGEFATGLKQGVLVISQMVTASIKGQYHGLSKKDISLIVAAIIYLVSPIDLVPDAIPMLGLLDDMSLLTWLINKFAKEIDMFTQWQNTQLNEPDLSQMSYKELYELAQEKDLTGRSGMKKAELYQALIHQN